ncbi:MAG: hypothetical protein V1902_02840 [Candidatus Falkowbacteria bacterium]
MKNKFIQNSFIYVAGTIAAGFLGYIFQFVISRKLSVAQYGEFQSLMAASAIFGIVSSAISYFVIKYSSVFAKNNDYASNNSFLKLTNAKMRKLAILLVVGFLLLSPILKNYLRLDDYYGLILVALTLYVGLITTGYTATLSGWQMFAISSGIGIFFGILKLLAGIIGTQLSPTSTSILFFLLIFSGISAFVSYWVVRQKFYNKTTVETGYIPSLQWKQKYFATLDVGKSILPITLFALAVALLQNIDLLIVKNLTTAEIAGQYAALNVLGKIIFWINGAIIAVVLPTACATGIDGNRPSRKLAFSAYGLIGFVSLCGIAAYFIAPNFIVSLLFGAKYLIFAKELWLFGVMAFALSILMLEANFAYARHDFRVNYIIGSVVLMMIIGIYGWHATIQIVVLDIIVAMLLGFIGMIILNNCQTKNIAKTVV